MAIPVFPTVDKWPLHPFDPKCKKFVPFDPVVDEQIRCKVPLWSGNFDELKPELTAEGQGLRLADLPLLTVHDIGQYVIRAAQGGSMRAGPIGTAVQTIVLGPALRPHGQAHAVLVDDENMAFARKNFGWAHWRILQVCVDRRLIDLASAESTDDISAYVAGNGGRAARGDFGDLRRNFDFLRKHGFLAGKQGVGTYATPKGVAVVKLHADERGGANCAV
jgi:hypothetical protein